MEYEDLLLDKENGIATITLNRPDKLNALTAEMRDSLPLVVDELAKDDEVRVVIVTGAGRGFCAGVYLGGARGEPSRYQRLQVYPWTEHFPKLNKPVIAAVNGVAVGLGFALAMSCDIRIASEAAKFGSVFILRGLAPDSGTTYFLPRAVGTSKAFELMYTGEIIDAVQAERWGIVNRVVPPDELMKVTRELAARIAQQPPVALDLTKKIVWRGMIDGLTRQLDLERWANQICGQTEDNKEAVRAFLEKRPPAPFKGR